MKKLLAFVLACAMLVSACGGSSGGESTSGGSSSGDAGTGAAKDTLTIAKGADVTSMDPHVGKETPAIEVTDNIFNTLVVCTDNMEPAPSIAESWEQKDDKTWTFKIKQGIKFHDGSELTAADVKFSLERAVASSYVAYIVDFIETVTADDDYTVTVVTKAPYAPILMNLAHPSAAIVPKAAIEKDEAGFKTNPIGTGPYKMAEWKQGEYIRLEAFDECFQGAPKTKTIVFRVVPEAAQRTISLETGEVDLAYDVQPNDLEKIRSNSNLALFEAPSLSAWYLAMNSKKEPFNNVKVRQAIRHAVDSQTIVDTLAYGSGQVANSLIPPMSFGYSDKSKAYPFDVEAAKALMKEAGYENGFKCVMMVNDNQSRVEICQVVQSQLKEIGIEMEIKVMEFGSFIEATSNGEHDMGFFGWTCSTSDADYTYYSLFHSTQQGAPGNRSFVNDPKIDELIMNAKSTADSAKRQAYYDELETYLGDPTFYAPIYYNNLNVGASSKVKDFSINPAGYHKLANVTVTE